MDKTKNQILEKVAERGGRWTQVREAVLQVFKQAKKPLTVADVYRKLSSTGIDLASIYRTINLFCHYNVLHHEDTVIEGKRYELSEHYENQHHHHLICESCGQTEDYFDCAIANMEKQISKEKKFLIKRHDLKFIGICKRCRR